MAESVSLACGELPRFFNFAVPTAAAPTPQPVNYFTGATTGVSQAMYCERVYKTFQASSWLLAGTAVTATVTLQCTNDTKTAVGAPFAVGCTNGSATVTSGGLFNGYYNPVTNQWVPAVMVGDVLWVNGQSLTVSAVASANSLTASANITATGSLNATIFGQLWSLTTAVTLTPAGTPLGVADATLVSAHRWVRANLSALTSSSTYVQVMMGI